MELIFGNEVSKIDRLAQEQFGLSGLQLMENAGRAGADAAEALLKAQGLPKTSSISVVAGKGNNGGDAFVVARHLANRGYTIKLFILADLAEFCGDAKTNLVIVQKLQLPYEVFGKESKLCEQDKQAVGAYLQNSSLLVDGIFGTGFQGQAPEWIATFMGWMNQSNRPILALDVPSGVDATTGQVLGMAVFATHTITFGWAKFGTAVLPGKAYAGKLQVADISLPKALLNYVDNQVTEPDALYAKTCLGNRQKDSHKGSFGHCLVVGGSKNMFGSPILAAGGALKSGAGLVTLGSVAGVGASLTAHFPEAMTLSLEAEAYTGKEISLANAPFLLDFAKDKVLVLGMGLGRSEQTQKLALKLMEGEQQGLVLDADALFALAKSPVFFGLGSGPVVLTPHPKELGALLGISAWEVQQDRLKAVCACAQKYGATVVLKGSGTLICSRTLPRVLFVNPTGNPGMATGGSGDVLAGIIGSLLGQGLGAAEAAALGVYLHGLAGDFAKEALGEYSLSAGDLIRFLPKAFLAVTG